MKKIEQFSNLLRKINKLNSLTDSNYKEIILIQLVEKNIKGITKESLNLYSEIIQNRIDLKEYEKQHEI